MKVGSAKAFHLLRFSRSHMAKFLASENSFSSPEGKKGAARALILADRLLSLSL